MLSLLNEKEIIIHLENLLSKPDFIKPEDINELQSKFPFNFGIGLKNPNFLMTIILRKRKDLVNYHLFAKSLGINKDIADSILNNQDFYASFPISDGSNTMLAKALVIPLEIPQVITPDPIPHIEHLEILKDLSNSGFYITFDTVFDYSTSSYMLGVYSVLKFGNKAEKIAFTGKITPSGTIEMVSNLQEKIECSRSKGVPLVFPHECMKSIADLEKFFNNLEFPVAILPSKEPSQFINQFHFTPSYLSQVFHLSENPTISEPLDNTVEGFSYFAERIDRLSSELAKSSKFLPFKVALTTSVLALSFYAGVRFSKYHLPVSYYKFINTREGYQKYFVIEKDFNKMSAYKPKIIKEDSEIRKVLIVSKSPPTGYENALIIKVPEGDELDKDLLQIAYSISSLIRKKDISGSAFCLEIPAGMAFALGYFIEDYKTIHLTHFKNGEYKPVLIIGAEKEGKLYLTNAFSLNMLEDNNCYIAVKKISLKEAKDLLLKKGFQSYISHESTATILTKLLKTEVKFRRDPLTLNDGDELIVFQLKVRLKEGQVLGREELESLIKNDRFAFLHVKVFA